MRLLPTLLALPLLALLLGSSCKKDKDNPTPQEQLPPATTSGADTWGCLVNGKIWKAYGASRIRADWTVPEALFITMGFTTYADNQTERHNINFSFPDSTHRYSLRNGYYRIGQAVPVAAWASIQTPTKLYDERSALSGLINITRLDRSAGIVSGTFDFVMVGSSGDTIRVTQGRFDTSHMDL